MTPPGRTPRPLRVAVVPSFTADNVLPLLRVGLLAAGIAPTFHLTAPDQQLMALGRPGSPLDDFAPDLTLCLAHEDVFLPRDWDPTDLAGLAAAVDERAGRYTAAVASFAGRTTGSVLLHTVPLPSAWPRTVTSHRSRAGIGRLWRELNLRLLDLAERTASVDALDLETLLADCPSRLRDERLFRFASMAWAPAVERLYAQEAAGYGRALAGLGKKCLVLDLDNTLWGGVLGDDGPENIEIGPMYPGNAYAAVQRTALALRRQGVLLAVASKNDPGLVERVLGEHPELVLRRDDFVSVHANWDAKDGSIRAIADELNIGLDSMVFLDDSPFECDLVRGSLPQVEVVRAAGTPRSTSTPSCPAGTSTSSTPPSPTLGAPTSTAPGWSAGSGPNARARPRRPTIWRASAWRSRSARPTPICCRESSNWAAVPTSSTSREARTRRPRRGEWPGPATTRCSASRSATGSATRGSSARSGSPGTPTTGSSRTR